MPADKKKNINCDELFNLNPEEYEKKYVHDTYNVIATHFSMTRHKPWPQVKKFLESLSNDSIMIDVGCGNGKNLGISPGVSLGCDICPNLLDIARKRGYNVTLCDALKLPYKDNFADAVISIAVIHHFTSEERRICAIKEMLRILKPNGKLLIYVWANNDGEMKDKNDCFVRWSNLDNVNHNRYYHFFNEGELEKLCSHLDNCIIEKSYFDKENWAVILKKI